MSDVPSDADLRAQAAARVAAYQRNPTGPEPDDHVHIARRVRVPEWIRELDLLRPAGERSPATVRVDLDVLPLVRAVWRLGIPTYFSCQGGAYEDDEVAYVVVPNDSAALLAAIATGAGIAAHLETGLFYSDRIQATTVHLHNANITPFAKAIDRERKRQQSDDG